VGETTLFECARRAQLSDVVGDLLQWGADATSTDIERNTALHVSAAAGNVAAAECLLAAGADVHAANEYGNTALHNAVVHGQVRPSRLLSVCLRPSSYDTAVKMRRRSRCATQP